MEAVWSFCPSNDRNEEVMRALEEKAQQTLDERMEHEITRLLEDKMNSPVDLIDSICDFLRNSTIMNMDLATKKMKKALQVIAGYLPPKKSVPDPDFPFVIVRIESFEDKLDGATANVNMVIGTYSEDAQDGWRDVVNIATRVGMNYLKSACV